VMIYRMLTIPLLAGFLAAQNDSTNHIPCGFSCARNLEFPMVITGDLDGRPSCSFNHTADLVERCHGCCQAYALWGGLSTVNAVGFPTTYGRSCICCVNNNNC
ncbi:hypothetical protein PMAYCL1PPCAC_20214, partial [Pristionchus mayeri]